jgi:hypothetical protein
LLVGLTNPDHLLLLFGLAVLVVLPTILTVRLASRKGRSPAVYLIASLVIGWPVPLLIALVLPRKA